MKTVRCCTLHVLLVGAMLTFVRVAAADAVSCTKTHAAGQREEKSGLLGDALISFRQCASDVDCPRPIRNECAELFTAVEVKLPTVVFSVVDAEDNDIADVRVSSASGVLATGLDGRPVAVDPGSHDLRFELPSGQVLTKTILVRQGEKDRLVSVRATSPQAPTQPLPSAPDSSLTDTPKPGAQPSRSALPAVSWVSYLVGGAALGTWGTFALLGRGKERALAGCSPRCPATMHRDYRAMRDFYLTADIALGVSAAALVLGTGVLVFKRREKTSAAAGVRVDRGSLSLLPAARRDGGMLLLQSSY